MALMLKHLRAYLLLAGAALFSLPPAVLAATPLPSIPEANARFSDTQGCVEPTEEMRKNHMEYILHQRDETMHKGIRTRQYSLEECINCHVPDPDASGKVVRYSDPEHFCASCHTYAAVDIDCFQCHADRPMKKVPGASGRLSLGHGTSANDPELAAALLHVLAEEGKPQ